MKVFSGYTEATPESLLMDAGAFFKNFDVEKDDFDSAVAAGKLLGATKDGGEFSATPTVRQIEVDGIKGKAKGLEVIDSWDVYLKANVLEIKRETLEAALCASKTDEASNNKYNIITAKNGIELTDYIDNVTGRNTVRFGRACYYPGIQCHQHRRIEAHNKGQGSGGHCDDILRTLYTKRPEHASVQDFIS